MKHLLKQAASLVLLAVTFSAAANPTPGDGWTVNKINDAITYYSFSGIEEVSGSPQQIYVIDQDLSNPRYALRFSYSDPKVPTSDILKRYDAIAAMNAGYESQSIVIKVEGEMRSCMPYDVIINHETVPNWKSEGAVYTDGGQNVNIAFAGKGMTIAEQREFYRTSTEPNILTSSPMLIDDYNPVGLTFVDPYLTHEQLEALDYEDPHRHQGVRHNRTAVAKTADNHLLLIAVDARHEGISEGMSAAEFTDFIIKWFNPQYALNMDGGGSTTMCVRGYGEPSTNVVNYPTDNGTYDHFGERRRDTHFYIVELPGCSDPDAGRPTTQNTLCGLDAIYDMTPKELTPAPKGYKPAFIQHYGRHGSRYAYTSAAYSVPLEMLQEGKEQGNLTPRGEKLLTELEKFWAKARYTVGDLTPLGWEQHQWIARNMVKTFPDAFKGDCVIDACSSASVRAILSMASECSSFSRELPKARVYAHQGILDMQAARPNDRKNPFIYKGEQGEFPYKESSYSFFFRHFPQYEDVLGRLFKAPSKSLIGRNAYDVMFYYYMFVCGMNSVPEDEKVDITGLLTPEEYRILWEIDNYERYNEYFYYKTPCSSIVDDMIAKADARLFNGNTGADLRFGHDHVVMSLLMIMDIDDYDTAPASQDDLAAYFKSYRSPMAANLQMVFYTSKNGGEPLVKILLNGEEARFGKLATVQGPYYKWSDLKSYLESRIDLFVTEK